MKSNAAAVGLHVQQWMHNRKLLSMLPETHPDWVVTAVFYTAVHAVDATLAHLGFRVSNHDQRFECLGKINQMKKIRELFHPLYNLSRTVRYTAQPSVWLCNAMASKGN